MDTKFIPIHTVTETIRKNHPSWNMPYVPAIKVCKGTPLYISGVNAAPIYHSHPHQQKEFDHLDLSVESQTRLTMENLKAVLEASHGTMSDVVQLIVFIVDIKNNAERVGQIISSYFSDHLPTSTVIGVTELFTDPRLILEVTATAYI